MKIPVLRESVCGLSLEAGSKIIAIFCLVHNCFGLLSSIIVLSVTSSRQRAFYKRVETDYSKVEVSYSYNDFGSKVIIPVMCYMLIMFLALLTVNCLLYYGITKKIKSYLLPWMAVKLISIISGFLTFISVSIISGGTPFIGTVLAPGFIFGFVGSGFHTYLLWVVYSYYEQFEEQNPNTRQTGFPQDHSIYMETPAMTGDTLNSEQHNPTTKAGFENNTFYPV